jgi:DNA ligase-4
VNDKTVMDLTLEQRVALLHRCIPQTKSHLIEISLQKKAKTTQEILDALDQAVQNRYFGDFSGGDFLTGFLRDFLCEDRKICLREKIDGEPCREEGIMIKSLDSVYKPNERKDKWIKLKPEYIDGVGDDLDLIIMGTGRVDASSGERKESRI